MITFTRFLMAQPSYPDEQPTDKYYFDVANALLNAWENRGKDPFSKHIAEPLRERIALSLIGYYQDVIADAGLWHAFIDEHQRLYGRRLPFYETAEDYIHYELNPEDVRFMIWYCLITLSEEHRYLSPLDKGLASLSDALYDVLEAGYEDAPIPIGYNLRHELEMHNPEDQDSILTLGNWLFMHSWLLTPASAIPMSEMMSQLQASPGFDINTPEGQEALGERLGELMVEDPTGPLALYTREWVYLMVYGKLPTKHKRKESDAIEHSYYTAFMAATGGKKLVFIATYDQLNRFLIDSMGWSDNEEHLQSLKNDSDFVLMADREKGLLIARNIARCIKHPDNPLYNKVYASSNAFRLLSVRGVCPGDLLRCLINENALPDASFPKTDTGKLVSDNADFISRIYLQKYYRGD